MNTPISSAFDALIAAGTFAVCAGPFALVVGVLPGVLLGALGGLLIGALVTPFRHTISAGRAALIGLSVSAVIGIAGNLLLGPGLIEPHRAGFGRYFAYLFWVAGPGLLVLAGGTGVGWVLARRERDLNGDDREQRVVLVSKVSETPDAPVAGERFVMNTVMDKIAHRTWSSPG